MQPGLRAGLLPAGSCSARPRSPAHSLLPRLALQSPFRVLASHFSSTAARCNPQICLSFRAPPSSVSSAFNSVPDSHLHCMCGVSPIPCGDPVPGEEGSRFREAGCWFRQLSLSMQKLLPSPPLPPCSVSDKSAHNQGRNGERAAVKGSTWLSLQPALHWENLLWTVGGCTAASSSGSPHSPAGSM